MGQHRVRGPGPPPSRGRRRREVGTIRLVRTTSLACPVSLSVYSNALIGLRSRQQPAETPNLQSMGADHKRPVGLHYRRDAGRADAKQQRAVRRLQRAHHRPVAFQHEPWRTAGAHRADRVESGLSGRRSPAEMTAFQSTRRIGQRSRGHPGGRLPHQVGNLLADHDCGGVGVAGHHGRHDRGVGDAQAADPVHSELGIDHR
jgi:hypothetical protein